MEKDNIEEIDSDQKKNTLKEQEKQHTTSLSKKEFNSLKSHKYEEATKKYKKAYTIMNQKTGLIVEMRAASPLHACIMIGWRPKNCKMIKEEIIEENKQETQETQEVS